MSLVVGGLSVTHRLGGISFTVHPGEMLAVIGANGAGKSTLLHAISGDVATAHGRIGLDGESLASLDRRRRAQRMACLAQAQTLAFPLSGREVIALARSPHATGRAIDAEIVAETAAAMDVTHLLDRVYTRLSGGERQRLQLARVLAQIWRAETPGSRLLLLDEPVAALDIGHQALVMRRLARLKIPGVVIVVVLHDVTLAAAHADHLLALRAGRAIAWGAPDVVVNEATLARVFDVRTRVIAHPDTGTPVVLHG